MRRLSITGLLAAWLLASPGGAPANPPEQCGYGYGPAGYFAFGWFSKIHQHGPLFNYGPYYGYPPFEPYGPWNAYLQYNPWYYGQPDGGKAHHAWGHRLHLGCGSHCCWHAHWGHGGWFHGHGCLSCGHGKLLAGHGGWGHLRAGHCKSCGTGHSLRIAGGCASAQASAFDPAVADPVGRLAGAGNPIDSAAFYAGFPALDPAVVTPAAYAP